MRLFTSLPFYFFLFNPSNFYKLRYKVKRLKTGFLEVQKTNPKEKLEAKKSEEGPRKLEVQKKRRSPKEKLEAQNSEEAPRKLAVQKSVEAPGKSLRFKKAKNPKDSLRLKRK